jgi:hypothetical protein
MAIWYILWPFGTFYGSLVYIFPFWYVVPSKICQPCPIQYKNIVKKTWNFHFGFKRFSKVTKGERRKKTKENRLEAKNGPTAEKWSKEANFFLPLSNQSLTDHFFWLKNDFSAKGFFAAADEN